VRNAALGFNQALSYGLCVDEFYGADADWVHWEMGALAGAQDDGTEVRLPPPPVETIRPLGRGTAG
jgi:hypothetical protein